MKRWLRRVLWALLVVLVMAGAVLGWYARQSLPQTDGERRLPGLRAAVEVRRRLRWRHIGGDGCGRCVVRHVGDDGYKGGACGWRGRVQHSTSVVTAMAAAKWWQWPQ